MPRNRASYEYTIYELHYWVKFLDSGNISDEMVRVCQSREELNFYLDELKRNATYTDEWGSLKSKVLDTSYIQTVTTKREFGLFV